LNASPNAINCTIYRERERERERGREWCLVEEIEESPLAKDPYKRDNILQKRHII